MHPKQREYEQREDLSTFIVTIESENEFHNVVREDLQTLEHGNLAPIDGTPVLSFTDHDHLLHTFTPQTLDLLTTIRQEQPSTVNETARVVDRDVKNVHDELAKLEALGVIHFQQDG
jgi:predicted transcriptional regulator